MKDKNNKEKYKEIVVTLKKNVFLFYILIFMRKKNIKN
jgi:hypothetical protein